MFIKNIYEKLISSYKNLTIIITLAILDLFFLYLFKYTYNDFSFTEFSLNKFGNQLNLFITAIFVLPAMFLATKKYYSQSVIRVIVYLTIGYFLIDIFAFIFALLNISFPSGYMLGYPFKKIFIVFLFATGLIIKIYLIFILWKLLIGKKTNVFVSAFAGTFILIILLLILTYFNNLFYEPLNTDKIENQKYDVAVVLGAAVWQKDKPSPIFRGRIEKAFELLKKGIVKNIQVTGGSAPGELSEAKTAFNYLSDKYKIDKNLVFIEEETTTTSEQIRFIKRKLVEEKGLKKILIISDKFHLRRVLEMCDFFNTNAYGISSDYELNWKELFLYRFRDILGLLIFWLFAV